MDAEQLQRLMGWHDVCAEAAIAKIRMQHISSANIGVDATMEWERKLWRHNSSRIFY
jgi:hypothetical protein